MAEAVGAFFMRLNPIPQGDWISTRRAGRLMFAAAMVTALTTAVLLALNTSTSVALRLEEQEHTAIANLLGAVGAVGVFTLYFGMWRHWYQQRPNTSAAWAIAFIIAAWYGSLAYWAVQYRTQGR